MLCDLSEEVDVFIGNLLFMLVDKITTSMFFYVFRNGW